MGLTGKQKKYIKKNIKKKTVTEIAASLTVPVKEIEEYLKKRWGKGKYQRFLRNSTKKPSDSTIQPLGLDWFKQRRKIFVFLAFLVFLVYANALGNDFVSDDIRGIVNNEHLGNLDYALANKFNFVRPLLYFIIYKIAGLTPSFFRVINIFFHLGSVWSVFVLLSLMTTPPLPIFVASIFAIHPILTESITWISGGGHVQYSFFLLISFVTYLFYLSRKDNKVLILSLLSFLLALNSSEKAIVLPLLFLLFLFSFQKLSKKWVSLVPFFLTCGYVGLKYLRAGAIEQRITSLQAEFYQEPTTYNPLLQIPIAITSYLKLIFWPKNLTLYHSEMIFSQGEYFLRLVIFIVFLGIIIYSYKHNRHIFFWLSFFIISLLPTLTPFGISWIVAERYVYLGSIGIFVVIALLIQKIGQIFKNKNVSYAILGVILIALSIRTIVRNNDWRNQDTLWLAAAKTSPSSPQNHNNLGDLYGRRGDFEKSIYHFKKAIELKPGYAAAYHNLGNTYQLIGKINLAIENYQKALSFNPNLWQSHQNLAVIYYQQGKLDLVRQELKKLLQIDPGNQKAKQALEAIK